MARACLRVSRSCFWRRMEVSRVRFWRVRRSDSEVGAAGLI